MSARSANVNCANRSIDTIKVAQHDGKYSWRDYLVQFELAAHANKWDMLTSAVKLACSLRGSAQALLSDLTPEVRYDYDRLVTALTERFEPENQCEIYKAQMKQRIRKRDESLSELAQDIKRLTRMAYPSAVLDLRDCLSKDCFVEALNDAEMELFICQKEPERLEDAVRIALKYEAFTQGRRKRLMSAKTGIRMQRDEVSQNTIMQNQLREISANLRELKANSSAGARPGIQTRNTDRPGCFICKDPSHFQRECPHRYTVNGHPRLSDWNRGQNRSGYGQEDRNGRFNAKFDNQNTERTMQSQPYRSKQNVRQNRNSGNAQRLRPRVRAQL